MTTKQRSTRYLPTLDGLRGLASLTVVMHHLGQHLDLKHGFHHGYLAVPFFFTLSGFVIARSYEPGLRSRSASLLSFAKTRAIRLYPVIFLGAIVSAFTYRDLTSSFMSALVIPTFFASSLFPVNGPEWSLLLEILGNAVHGLTARKLRTSVLSVVIGLSSVLVLRDALHDHSVGVGWGGSTFISGLWLFISTYSIGIAIARFEHRLPRLGIPALAVFTIFLLVMAWPSHPGTLSYVIRDVVSSLVLFPLLLGAGISSPLSYRIDKASRILGEISYPLYLLHVPVIHASASLMSYYRVNVITRYELAPLVFIGCVASGWLAWKYYDVPVRRTISRILLIQRDHLTPTPT